jgi:nesprin-1
MSREIPTLTKLEELDKIENVNLDHMDAINKLFLKTKELMHEYPDKEIPQELNATEEIIQNIEHTLTIEREKLLQMLALAEEYEQTLQEFSQITKIAENLLESPISVVSLEQLREEMQKHRKFFVNLNYCRAILESLEDNLDPETKEKYSKLHTELHNKAVSLLDQASSKAQQMSLAASRWVVLEQGIKEESGWLQVAYQRVPELQNVTSTEYDQYISLYQVTSFL